MKRKTKLFYVFALAFLLSVCALVSLPKTASASQSFDEMIHSANNGDTITLTQSYVSNGRIDIQKDLTIDLAFNEINAYQGIVVSNGAKVTIKNGNLRSGQTVVSVNNATATIQNVIFQLDSWSNGQGISAQNNAKLTLNSCYYSAGGNLQIYSKSSELTINSGTYYATTNVINAVGGKISLNNTTIRNMYSARETVYGSRSAVCFGDASSSQGEIEINGGEIASLYCGEGVSAEVNATVRKIFNDGNLYLNGGLVGNVSEPLYNECDTALVNQGYAEINGGVLSADDQNNKQGKTIINKGPNAQLVIKGGTIFGATTVIEASKSSKVQISGGKIHRGEITLVEDYTGSYYYLHSVSDMFAHGFFAKSNGAFVYMSGETFYVDASFEVVEHTHTGTTATCRARSVCSECNNAFGDYNYSNHEIPTKTYAYSPTEGTHYVKYICCDYTISENHTEGSYQIVRAPTAEMSGQKMSTCSVCGRTWYQEIPRLSQEDQMAMAMAENIVAFMILLGVVWIFGMFIAIAFIVSDVKKKKEKRAKVEKFINDFKNKKE